MHVCIAQYQEDQALQVHKVQDIDVYVQNSHRLNTLLLPPHAYKSTSPPEA